MRQDEVLYRIADRVKNFAVLYVCDLDQVPDFKQMYELYDPVTLMFFFRNKHMVCMMRNLFVVGVGVNLFGVSRRLQLCLEVEFDANDSVCGGE